jgi:Tfp pilus assembly protein PilV
MALIEALVASAVLSVGLAGASRLTLHTLQIASDTRQHTVALALALDAMDCHQSDRAGCLLQSTTVVQGTTYSLESQVTARTGLALVDLQVQVTWPAIGRTHSSERLGTPEQKKPSMGQITLHSSRDAVPAWLGVSLP